MAVKTASELKALFAAGKYPTAADYTDLIDSLAGGSGIETLTTFNSDSNMFSSNKSVGAVEIIVNNYSSDSTISVPTTNGSTTFNVPAYGAIAFVKIDDSNNYWTPIALPIQQGGSNGDLGNS